MRTDLDRELAEARQEMRRREKLRDTHARASEELSRAAEQRQSLKVELEKEGADVAKLEGLSFTNLVVSLFGDKDRKLDEEKKELARAKLRYDEHLTEFEALRDEVAELDRQLQGVAPDLDERYAELLREKEELLLQGSSGASRELVELGDRLADASSVRIEIDEAIQAGQSALAAMKNVARELDSASNWGIVDMAGGGLLTTMIKHGKLDGAKRAAAVASKYLRRFSRELQDVQIRSNVAIDVGGFAKFADYFLDGLLFDWIVQSKIGDAKRDVDHKITRLRRLMRDLRARGGDAALTLEQLQARRIEIIDSA